MNRLAISATFLTLITTAVQAAQATDGPARPARSEPQLNAPTQGSRPGDVATDLDSHANRVLAVLSTERQIVDRALAAETKGLSRADMLAAYGRSAASSGQFRESAAAYAMLLSEFGLDHAYSQQILVRLGACLAPLDLDSVEVLQTADGPQYRPTWRMEKAASAEQVRLAIGAYELLASVATDNDQKAQALLSLGWVHRALNDWNASTAAWDRAADSARDSVVGADALWHAADNLAWTGQPAEAAKRLRRLTAEHPSDARNHTATDRMELLEAESRRTPEWIDNPVAAVEKEIVERAGRRKPNEVYRSAVQWLQSRRNPAAVIALSRWAAAQNDWPVEARLQAHYDLTNALLTKPDATDAVKAEAADVLDRIASMAPADDWALPAAIHRSRLLSELGRFEAADKTLAATEARWKGNPHWEPGVLIERMQSLVDRGDLTAAKFLHVELHQKYPDYELPAELARTLAPSRTEVADENQIHTCRNRIPSGRFRT